MRDLRADWQKWTPSERFFGLVALPAMFVVVALPYLMAL
jgi:hypothetical protein